MKTKYFLFGLAFVLIICIAIILVWSFSDENRYLRSYCKGAGGEYLETCSYLENITFTSTDPCCQFPDGQICNVYQLIRGECR